MKTITIRLEGIMQSYGESSDSPTANYKTTGDHPTKSAIIGMIASALGYRRDDERIESLNKLSYAVRIDQPGSQMIDYQNVRYREKSEVKNTRTWHYNLQEAVFLAAVSSQDDKAIEKIEYALHHPRFALFLGRRSNVPFGPLETKCHDSMTPVEVLETAEWQAEEWYMKWYRKKFPMENTAILEIYADAELLPERPKRAVRDVVKSFSQNKRMHKYRLEAHTSTSVDFKFSSNDYQDHDAMKML